MQREAPALFDLSQRDRRDAWGCTAWQRGQNTGFGWQCLVARRLAERGVRFIELIDTGSSNNWDSHGNMNDHIKLAKNVDQPIAGLLTRPEAARHARRHAGRLDHRVRPHARITPSQTPWAASTTTRRSAPGWPAAASKRGIVHGATDDYGISIADDKVHVHDFHATILHLLGLDHERLTYRHSGRDYRLTDVSGQVVREIMA